ncbi:MAG: hypothetical protein Q9201_001763 [Fulgogasparrea decipioides]
MGKSFAQLDCSKLVSDSLDSVRNSNRIPLQRPEPSTTKKLSIVTLTRIFLLTHGHQSLIREITTPSLSTFITACLRATADGKSSDARRSTQHDYVLSTVLWAFGDLLPHHPAAFRPFVGQTRALVLPLIAPTSSNLSLDDPGSKNGESPCPSSTAERARQVFVLLSGCAPKNTQSQEWAQSLSVIIVKTHETADLVFRAIFEDWEPSVQTNRSKAPASSSCSRVVQSGQEESDLPGWFGICAGLERLDGLLLTIRSHLNYPSATALPVPTGKLVDAVDRILSALPPSVGGSNGLSTGTRTNPEISRDERESLFSWLPQLHVSALRIIEQLAIRFEQSAMAIDQRLLSHALWIFENERPQVRIRQAVYGILARILIHCASGVHRAIASSLASVLKTCCEDLVSTQADPGDSPEMISSLTVTSNKLTMNADAYFQNSDPLSKPLGTFSEVQPLAESLLCSALTYLPSNFLPFSVRSKIDRTAVLAQSKRILQASVLNPPVRRKGKQQSSIMPMLARQFPQSESTEALIRPRMPPVQLNADGQDIDTDYEVDERGGTVDGFARRSAEPSGMPPSPEHEMQGTLGFEIPKNGETSTGIRPSPAPSVNREQQGTDLRVPVKRSLDVESEEMTATSSGEIKPPTDVGHTAPSKRMRDGFEDRDIVPTAEDHSVAISQTEEIHPHTADREPLSPLTANKDIIDDEDSDDSSIPAIDPTLDTEDEEDNEEDQI